MTSAVRQTRGPRRHGTSATTTSADCKRTAPTAGIPSIVALARVVSRVGLGTTGGGEPTFRPPLRPEADSSRRVWASPPRDEAHFPCGRSADCVPPLEAVEGRVPPATGAPPRPSPESVGCEEAPGDHLAGFFWLPPAFAAMLGRGVMAMLLFGLPGGRFSWGCPELGSLGGTPLGLPRGRHLGFRIVSQCRLTCLAASPPQPWYQPDCTARPSPPL